MGLRIIAGYLKRKKLYSPDGFYTRPTSDRLRESIFNILAFDIQKTVVLDLFAGTGAFGIEALSRGAASVVFVDHNPKALSVLKRNLQSCNLGDRTTIIKWDIKKNLNCLKPFNSTFDLVFMDPPYNKNLIQPTLTHLFQGKSLLDRACIVVEHALLEPILDDMAGFSLVKRRKYGKIIVSFLRYVI